MRDRVLETISVLSDALLGIPIIRTVLSKIPFLSERINQRVAKGVEVENASDIRITGHDYPAIRFDIYIDNRSQAELLLNAADIMIGFDTGRDEIDHIRWDSSMDPERHRKVSSLELSADERSAVHVMIAPPPWLYGLNHPKSFPVTGVLRFESSFGTFTKDVDMKIRIKEEHIDSALQTANEDFQRRFNV